MSLSFGPKALSVVPSGTSEIAVVVTDTGTPASLTAPVALDSQGRISFTVAASGHYTLVVTIDGANTYRRKVLLEDTPEQSLSDAGEIRAAIRANTTSEVDVAGLNNVGWAKAVFIENEGTIPLDAEPYTIVIEQA